MLINIFCHTHCLVYFIIFNPFLNLLYHNAYYFPFLTIFQHIFNPTHVRTMFR